MNTTRMNRTAFRLVQGPNLHYMARRFRKYQQSNLPLSARANNHAELSTLAGTFRRVVVGSDQVWNTVHGAVDPAYFLSGIRSAKFSYAASMGSAYVPRGYEDKVKTWLSDFETISVREPTARDTLNSLGIKSRVDVDPVLLHDGKYWENFAGETLKPSKKYILVYQLHNTPQFTESVDTIARRYGAGYEVRRVTVDAKQRLRSRATDYMASPQEFVQLFRNSELVITDSFHGTAFSLIHGRPFHVVLPQRNTSRLTDILDSVGLNNKHLEAAGGQHEYDADRVGVNLKEARQKSLEYIKLLAST